MHVQQAQALLHQLQKNGATSWHPLGAIIAITPWRLVTEIAQCGRHIWPVPALHLQRPCHAPKACGCAVALQRTPATKSFYHFQTLISSAQHASRLWSSQEGYLSQR